METLRNLTLIQWIGIILGLNALFTASTPQLTTLFGAVAVPYIQAVCTLGSGALGVFVSVIGGSASQIRNVAALPGVESIKINSNALPSVAAIAVDPAQEKVDATDPATRTTLQTIARS